MRKLLSLLLLVSVALAAIWFYRFTGDGQVESSDTASLNSSGARVRGLIVEPDDGREPLLEEIGAARDSIDVMIYLITDDQIVEALVAAEERGVEVRVILDQDPYGGAGNPEEEVARLNAAGAETRWSSSEFTFTHAKMIIIDREIVAILNLNLTRSAFESNREFGVVSTVPGDVREASTIFEADWAGRSPVLTEALVVSPINSRTEIIGLIDAARKTIQIYAEVVRDDEVIDHLIHAADRGVTVRIIVPVDNDPVWDLLRARMTAEGILIRTLDEHYVHAKAVLIDDNQAYIGSENFTQTSLDENREIGIIVTDEAIIQRLETIFEADFAQAESGA